MAASATYKAAENSPKHLALSNNQDHFLEHKLPLLPRKRAIVSPVETELKFYVPAEIGLGMRKGREVVLIDQHILAKSLVPKLLERLGVSGRVSNHADLTSARVRRSVASNGAQTFSIEFKSSRFSEVSRFEFSLKINEGLYDKLSKECSKGAVRKLRYIIPGEVTVNGRAEKVKLQLDELVAAGRKLKPLTDSFFTADLEVSSERAIAELRKGRHSFTWLSECVELNCQRPALSKPLSSRTLAREGFGDKQLKTVARLDDLQQSPKKR
jgi:hypothetical protein